MNSSKNKERQIFFRIFLINFGHDICNTKKIKYNEYRKHFTPVVTDQ